MWFRNPQAGYVTTTLGFLNCVDLLNLVPGYYVLYNKLYTCTIASIHQHACIIVLYKRNPHHVHSVKAQGEFSVTCEFTQDHIGNQPHKGCIQTRQKTPLFTFELTFPVCLVRIVLLFTLV